MKADRMRCLEKVAQGTERPGKMTSVTQGDVDAGIRNKSLGAGRPSYSQANSQWAQGRAPGGVMYSQTPKPTAPTGSAPAPSPEPAPKPPKSQTTGVSGMTANQFMDNMKGYIKKYRSQLRGNHQAISTLRQMVNGVRSGRLNPSQIQGEWQKAMRLMPSGGQVNAYTNGTQKRRGQAVYRDAFDASGRRIKGTAINVNNAPAAPRTDAQGRITNPNSGRMQVGRGVYTQPRKENAADARAVERYAQQKYRSEWNDLAGSRPAPQGRQAPGSQGWWAQTADLLTDAHIDAQKRKGQTDAVKAPQNELRGIAAKQYF